MRGFGIDMATKDAKAATKAEVKNEKLTGTILLNLNTGPLTTGGLQKVLKIANLGPKMNGLRSRGLIEKTGSDAGEQGWRISSEGKKYLNSGGVKTAKKPAPIKTQRRKSEDEEKKAKLTPKPSKTKALRRKAPEEQQMKPETEPQVSIVIPGPTMQASADAFKNELAIAATMEVERSAVSLQIVPDPDGPLAKSSMDITMTFQKFATLMPEHARKFVAWITGRVGEEMLKKLTGEKKEEEKPRE